MNSLRWVVMPVMVGAAEEIIEKCNRLIASLQNFLLSKNQMDKILTKEIADKAAVDFDEAALLLYLISRMTGIFVRTGSDTDFYGVKDFQLNQSGFRNLMLIEDIQESINAFQARVSENGHDEGEFQISNNPTTATQVLAMHYLLNQIGINPIDDPTPATRLIQFFTGKELKVKKLQSTNIYKAVIRPLKRNDKALLKDLNKIRTLFHDLELSQIVDKIDKEIRVCESQI